ncbi:MAG: hypothetical protein ACRDQH_09980, partial [Pseudonocardiaceae bacterium]
DLHWADLASLRLLAYLAAATTSRLLLVATYRDHESAALEETLAALARAEALRIELTGLDTQDTQTLVSALAGREVSTRTTHRLWARTEGNPFFLRELIGLLTSEHRLDQPDTAPVPIPVREVVLRRIARLPQTTATVLSVAAVAGRHFDIDVVAQATSIEIEPALEALDAAIAAGLVTENHHQLGWFSFTHSLVAEALYETTTRARRVRRHRQIGQVATRVWAGHDERAAEIARHWLLAAELDPTTAAHAATHATTAARVADTRLAPEDAAALWRQALTAADLAGDEVDRYPLLIGLATSLYRAGNRSDGLPIFVQAMDHILGQDDSAEGTDNSRLIAAALGALGESVWYPVDYGTVDERLIDVLQRALGGLTDPVQRALLQSCLATACYYDDNPHSRATLSDEALALARPSADGLSLARVLRLRMLALHTPDYSQQCLQTATELLGLPSLPPPMVVTARLLRADSLTMLGRTLEATAEFDLVDPLAEQLRSRSVRMQMGFSRAGMLLLAGRWPEAEALSRATDDLNTQTKWLVAQAARLTQRWEGAFLTGRGGELVEDLRAAAAATGMPSLYSMLAMALTEAECVEDARRTLHCLVPGPKDYQWLPTLCWGLLAAARLGEDQLVTRLRAQLLPYRHLACTAGLAIAVSGSVAYFTAEGALALGDPDAALADLAIAVPANEMMGALPWLVLQQQIVILVLACLRGVRSPRV